MSHFHDSFETDRIQVVRYAIGAFAVNTYILMSKKTHAAIVVDPGGDVEEVSAAIRKMGAVPKAFLFTHLHIDHVTGAAGMKRAFPEAKITYHELDQVVADGLEKQSMMFGVPTATMPACEHNLRVEAEFMIEDLSIVSILTPGHTPGGVVYYLPFEKLAFTGDTLFQGSVGRTDFEGGSVIELRKSLKHLIEVLPNDTKLLPGHGKFTTMSAEKAENYYLRMDRFG